MPGYFPQNSFIRFFGVPIRWLLRIAAGSIALCVPITALDPAHAEGPRLPSVLFVMADQWRADAFGYAGNPDVRTPAFDEFASQSIRFINAVSTIPVCTPTRAALLTGRRAISNGVLMNDVPLDPRAITISNILAGAGYETGFIGKWHVDGHGRSNFIPPERRHGFKYWRAMECTHDYNRSYYYADSPVASRWKGYDADAQTKDAEKFIREQAGRGGKPFFLMLSWGPPHEPYETAPEQYRKMYSADRLTLRPNVPADHAERARQDLAGYYAHCSALDDCMRSLMATLKELEIDQHTIVVFTSDHGDMIGSHGAQKKQQPWDESCRVPMLFRYPSRFGDVGKTMPGTMATEDVMPTVLGLCGIEPSRSVQGLDFSRYMSGGKDPTDGAAIVMCPAPFGPWSRSNGGREFRAIRSQRYTYARDLSGPWILFDNQIDPFQMNNLVDNPAFAGIKGTLDRWLDRKLKKNHDRFEPARFYIKKWHYTIDSTGTVPYSP
jgi:arylsulfatase A-like enzyme